MQTQVRICEDADSLAAFTRNWLVDKIREHLASSSLPYSLALSGGSTPKLLYRLLGDLPEGSIDWNRVLLVWGDERNVPADHADSNFRMVRETLLDHIQIPTENVLAVPHPGGTAEEAARGYERLLRERLPGDGAGVPRLSGVLLGIGDDVHTASLFPGTTALSESSRLITENWVEKLNTWRITMTSHFLNTAQDVAFVISGGGKQQALHTLWNGPRNPDQYPAQLIQPAAGGLWYLVDRAALAQNDLPESADVEQIPSS